MNKHLVAMLVFTGCYYFVILFSVIMDIVAPSNNWERIYGKIPKWQFLIGLLPFGWIGIFMVKWFMTIGTESGK
jgi:hypothetical protein